jgi:hypothetical protein
MPKKREMGLKRAVMGDFEAINIFYTTGKGELNEHQQEIVERVKTAYSLLSIHPTKQVAVNKLIALTGLSDRQAARHVDFAMRFWNKHNALDVDFIESWFVSTLLENIASPFATGTEKARNLATLQKYIASLPEQKIDPKTVEKHNVYIQLNVKGNITNIAERDLIKLPESARRRILEKIPHEITEVEAEEILNS